LSEECVLVTVQLKKRFLHILSCAHSSLGTVYNISCDERRESRKEFPKDIHFLMFMSMPVAIAMYYFNRHPTHKNTGCVSSVTGTFRHEKG